MKLWTGRLNGQTDELFSAINDSLAVDARLVQEDVEGSIAWARALHVAKVLTAEQVESIEDALRDIAQRAANDPEALCASGMEDVHTWVESQLTERLGHLGKQLHTGRSRNDQVATDLRLWTLKAIDDRQREVRDLQEALLRLGKREEGTILPGYTHMQRAQPVLFAHWCLAYYDMLVRDDSRFEDASSRTARCPLGSGALSGTAYPIDRAALAQSLGFEGPTTNSLDAVSDRDFVVEALSSIVLCAVHLSRLAEDLIFYGSAEAGFVEFDDSVTSGSSMMPQKKNPDALELVRGKAGGAIGALVAMCVTLKGLPLSYNKDLQEDKVTLFGAMDNLSLSLRITARVIDSLRVNRERTKWAAQGAYANATELADYLAKQGVPFRDAHAMAGRIVRRAMEKGVSLEELPINEIAEIAPLVKADVRVHLTVDSALSKRDVVGGTAPQQVHDAIEQAQQRPPRKGRKRNAGATKKRGRALEVVPATVDHLEGIVRLVDYWAQQGENLPRTRDEILGSLTDFGVALHEGEVVGCGSLCIYGSTLAEIRSLGVDPDKHGLGVGSALVTHFLNEARRLHISRVFVLTRAPHFFERNGFRAVAIDVLPEKVFKDCLKCQKRSKCDEIAMICELQGRMEPRMNTDGHG
jgi:argininosuccinate lyase/amino-acid N-acetyltransferase